LVIVSSPHADRYVRQGGERDAHLKLRSLEGQS